MIGSKIFSIVSVPLKIDRVRKSLVARIWELQFKFFYYVGLVHYKPVYEEDNGCYTLKKGFILARILSVVFVWIPISVIHGLVIEVTISDLQYTENKSPGTYFHVLNILLVYFQNGLFLYIILRRKDLFQKLINHSKSSVSFVHSSVPKEKKCSSKNLALLYLVLAFLLRYVIAIVIMFELNYYYLSKLATPSDIFLAAVYSERWVGVLTETRAVGPILGITLTVVCWSGILINAAVNILIVGTIPITMWLATKEFTKIVVEYKENVRNGTCTDKMADEICSAYEQLKEYSESLNTMWSTLYLVYLTEMSLSMSFTLKEMLETENSLTAVYYVFLACLEATSLCLSGDVFKKIEDFKGWLTEEKVWERFICNHDERKLKRILRELDGRPIGIGKNGVYQLTYGFIAQMLIMMITLFTISFEK